MDLEGLRNNVTQFCESGNWSSALFWADKLLTLSESAPCDIVLYVRSLILSKQYLRALSFLQQHRLVDKHRVYQCFAVQCMLSTKRYEDAVKLIENSLTTNLLNCIDDDFLNEKCQEWRLDGALYLYLGQAYEELDNRTQAAKAYTKCLRHDVYCYEALSRLNKRHLLTSKEKLELIASLPFGEQCSDKRESDFLRYVYESLVRGSNFASKNDEISSLPVCDREKGLLSNNSSMLAAKAERLYYSAYFVDAYHLTSKILKREEFHSDCLIVHICLLVKLDKTNELFKLAHKLVDTYPDSHVSWYAVACYYVAIGNCEAAKRFFHKCTLLDPQFGEGWIGYGHSFAVEQEHDQAMNCYVKAAKLMSSCHIPLLYVGLEYSLTNNLKLGEKFLQEAANVAPDDPQILHEMGVLFYRQDNYVAAEKYFRKALEKVTNPVKNQISPAWESLLNNLGHTLRKLKRYDEALKFHYQALIMCPKDPSSLASIGYLHMFLENFEAAVEFFNQSLSLRREDSFARTMMSKAMEIMSENNLTTLLFEDVPKLPAPTNAVVVASSQKQLASKLNYNTTNESGNDSSTGDFFNQSSSMDVDMDL